MLAQLGTRGALSTQLAPSGVAEVEPEADAAMQQGEAHMPLAFNERKNLLVVLDTGRIEGFDPFTSGSRRFAIGRYPAKGVLGGVRE